MITQFLAPKNDFAFRQVLGKEKNKDSWFIASPGSLLATSAALPCSSLWLAARPAYPSVTRKACFSLCPAFLVVCPPSLLLLSLVESLLGYLFLLYAFLLALYLLVVCCCAAVIIHSFLLGAAASIALISAWGVCFSSTPNIYTTPLSPYRTIFAHLSALLHSPRLSKPVAGAKVLDC